MVITPTQKLKTDTPAEVKKILIWDEEPGQNREIPEWMIFLIFLIVGFIALVALFYTS